VCKIAEALAVSPSTVSFVLTGQAQKRRISALTATRVEELARELGYVPNRIAQNLRNQRTGGISLLVGNLKHSWAEMLVKGANSIFDDLNYHTFISLHYWDRIREKKEIQLSVHRREEGIICQPVLDAKQDYELAFRRGIPMVFLDILPDMPGVSYVHWDAAPAAKAVMQHLIDIGRKRIAFVGYKVMTLGTLGRYHAYLESAAAAGQKPNTLWLSLRSPNENALNPEDVDCLRSEMARTDRPDAFFCLNDYTAFMIVRILHTLGVKVPDDVAVAGMGNLPITDDAAAGITTVREPVEEVGRAAAEVMVELITNRSQGPIQRLVQSTELMIRRTTTG
jgi:LacI family transcriptional regulator